MHTPSDSASTGPARQTNSTLVSVDDRKRAAAHADDLKTAITLAELLHRVEASTQAIGAVQYRRLAQHLAHLLDGLPPSARLTALLDTFPAAAVLYENVRYAQAGLCRVPLEASLASELQAREAINRARGLASAR